MATIPCPDDEILLSMALGRSVPAEVDEHLGSCSGCRDRLARLANDVRALRDVPTTEGEWHRPEDGPGPLVADTLVFAPDPVEARPSNIGQYVIVGLLDAGGQGIVYRAVHSDLRRDAVIKIARKPPGA